MPLQWIGLPVTAPTLPSAFFFYGTLMEGVDDGWTRHLSGRLAAAGAATVPGRLFVRLTAKGAYPLMTIAAPGRHRVRGAVYHPTPAFTGTDLAALDTYEGVDTARPERSEYERLTVSCTLGDGRRCLAAAYVAPRIRGHAARIEDGDFRAWLARTGHRPYGEPGRR